MAHTSVDDLLKKVNSAKGKVEVGETYYHWKNSDAIYTVLAVGLTEWDEEPVVVYQSTEGVVWIRRLEGIDGWLTEVPDRPGVDKSRFVKVEK